ncbi:MAG TPA: dihydrofolate reductase family protein [Polyangiaceae bacterium]|nr:dihydrofolate reductase family protein [Polyangiaceae bacterium]
MRARCSVYVATSLDGFIARSDGRIDWLSIVEKRGEDYGYGRFFGSIDTLVVGRKTYELALGFADWPYAGKRCMVMTRAKLAARHGETFFEGEPAALVDRLAREGSKHIYVDGGAVIQQFVAAGLVSDVTISMIPILLGEGIPLFGKIGRDVRLDLVESRAFDSGLVQLAYRIGIVEPT